LADVLSMKTIFRSVVVSLTFALIYNACAEDAPQSQKPSESSLEMRRLAGMPGEKLEVAPTEIRDITFDVDGLIMFAVGNQHYSYVVRGDPAVSCAAILTELRRASTVILEVNTKNPDRYGMQILKMSLHYESLK
jgi:hypothetical protein